MHYSNTALLYYLRLAVSVDYSRLRTLQIGIITVTNLPSAELLHLSCHMNRFHGDKKTEISPYLLPGEPELGTDYVIFDINSFLSRLKEASPPLRDSLFTSFPGGWRQLSVAALNTQYALLLLFSFFFELFKDQPLTQVGLFTVTLDPRPSWPQLLLPNMKSFPFSVETKDRSSWKVWCLRCLSPSVNSELARHSQVNVSHLLLRRYARPRRLFLRGCHFWARIYWERCRQTCSFRKWKPLLILKRKENERRVKHMNTLYMKLIWRQSIFHCPSNKISNLRTS